MRRYGAWKIVFDLNRQYSRPSAVPSSDQPTLENTHLQEQKNKLAYRLYTNFFPLFSSTLHIDGFLASIIDTASFVDFCFSFADRGLKYLFNLIFPCLENMISQCIIVVINVLPDKIFCSTGQKIVSAKEHSFEMEHQMSRVF